MSNAKIEEDIAHLDEPFRCQYPDCEDHPPAKWMMSTVCRGWHSKGPVCDSCAELFLSRVKEIRHLTRCPRCGHVGLPITHTIAVPLSKS